jgi:poly-gamma-glutamate capsule biosynthesis protein CapA/YwtB (metallophosphatase superfamily)
MKSSVRFVILLIFAFSIAYAVHGLGDRQLSELPVLRNVIEKPVEPFTFVMVGDVMLGRTVRNRMRASGNDLPFVNVAPIFAGADAVVVNLEGPITTLDAPDLRVSPEQPYSMRFAFDPIAAQVLRTAGVTHVSLANNHAGDQGLEGKEDTRENLTAAGVEYFGAPWKLDVGTVAHVRPEGHDVAFIGIDATIALPDMVELAREIESFGTSTHIVVFMHWGDEYQPVHNATQEAIAHALIDAGVDAVVGSHPHVIQDIEVYNGAPIFYSLGNFIFDQYWNADVRSGLALRITHNETGERYQLVPIDGNHAQPKLMEEPARQALLDALALRSQAELAESIKVGLLVI